MTVSLPLNPVAAARPRVTKCKRTGRNLTFYPKAYTGFQNDFKDLLGKQTKLHGPLSAYFEFHIQIPNSWTKKRKAEMVGKFHIQTPDTDNLQKAVLDGMNGNVYDDDSQVCEIFAVKRWAEKGRIVIKVEEIIKDNKEKTK